MFPAAFPLRQPLPSKLRGKHSCPIPEWPLVRSSDGSLAVFVADQSGVRQLKVTELELPNAFDLDCVFVEPSDAIFVRYDG